MNLKTASRKRMRAATLPSGQLWHPGPHESSGNNAASGNRNGGADADSIHAGHRSFPSEAVQDRRAAIGRSAIAFKDSTHLIDIFGISAGVLIMEGTRLVFRAAHPAFWELNGSCFSSAVLAERAAHASWMRFQHRSRPGTPSSGRNR